MVEETGKLVALGKHMLERMEAKILECEDLHFVLSFEVGYPSPPSGTSGIAIKCESLYIIILIY